MLCPRAHGMTVRVWEVLWRKAVFASGNFAAEHIC